MAKITIASIAIENLGPFRERQTLNLQVQSKRPVVLVKALNGSGKTTLLTALQIGLYGYKAINPLRRSEYEQLLLGLQRTDAVGNSAIEVGVLVEASGNRRELLVRREWSRKTDGLSEELTVLSDGAEDLDFAQTWDEFIGGILPAELVQLFLFDGEKIEALANPERLPDLLRRATEVFLGIGGIESLSNDLKAVERRAALKHKGASAEFDAARSNVLELDTQVSDLDKQHAVILQEHAAARNMLERAQSALDKYTVDAQRRGLTAYEQAARIRETVESTKKLAIEARADLADAMADPFAPLAWVGGLWPQYRTLWAQDQHSRHAKLLAQEFKQRDDRVVAAVSKAAPKATVDLVRTALAEDLRSLRAEKTGSSVVLQDADPKEMERQRDDGVSRLKRDLATLETTREGLGRAEQHVGQIPAEEQMSEILRAMQERSKTVSSAEALLSALAKQLEETQSHTNHLRSRLNAAQARLSTEFRDRSLETKGLEASARARQTLMLFKDRLLASKAQWLSGMITAEFKNLLRKRNLISRVIVDPSTYRVSIEDARGKELLMDRLSAGERQLLAISVLSALIKERKGRFPVVVDTPLARLDKQHRASLIKRFFATVSHQVVVLSTDQEVEGTAYDALQPYTSAEYSLEFDDASGRTTILSGAAAANMAEAS